MAVTVYDKAVLYKIRNLFSNSVYQVRENVLHTITDKNASVRFPLISFYRPDGWSISASNTSVINKEFSNGVRQLYVDLKYQIDIWASDRETLEDITSELVLYLLRNNGVIVTYKSSDGSKSIDVQTHLSYLSGPERTSEMEDSTVGRIYRYTLTYSLLDAVLLVFQPTDKNPDGSYPKDYPYTITQVIVEVIPEMDINSLGKTGVTVYKHTEELL